MSIFTGKMFKPLIIMLVIVGVIFGGIIAYKEFGKYMMNKSFAARKDPIVTVSSAKADSQVWKPIIDTVGSTRAVTGVNVTAQLAGMIQDIYFTPGAMVKKGEILVQQNADPNIGQLMALEANEKLAKITYMRDKQQYKAKGVSKQQLDTDFQNWKNFQGQVAQQKAIVEQLTITAPFDGKLGISEVYPGQFLNPGDTVVTLQSLDPIYLDFSIPQEQISHMKLGEEIQTKINTYPDMKFTGRITTINPVVDTSTRNIMVEATMPNPDHLLLPGMFANVSITRNVERKFTVVPKSAISFNPYGDIVYKLSKIGEEKGHAIYRVKQQFVTIGETRGDQVAVLSGVADGEQVVSSGQLKLRNGSRVVLNNKIQPSDSLDPKLPNQHNG